MSSNRPVALFIDDDKSISELMTLKLDQLGYQVMTADNGQSGWQTLEGNGQDVDIVIVDREMPVMNGIEFIHKVKGDPRFKHIPVIMQTAHGESEKIKEGLEAGVFYYLQKPTDDAVFGSVVHSAQKESSQHTSLERNLKKQLEGFRLIKSCEFTFQKLDEANNLGCFIANCYPDPSRVLPGLSALLINAVEHGSLGIGFDRKSELMKSGSWVNEVDRLMALPENQQKSISVKLVKSEHDIIVTITDEGQGFNWKKYTNLDPSRAMEVNGRGIALAKAMSFDKVIYNETGNSVSARYLLESEVSW